MGGRATGHPFIMTCFLKDAFCNQKLKKNNYIHKEENRKIPCRFPRPLFF